MIVYFVNDMYRIGTLELFRIENIIIYKIADDYAQYDIDWFIIILHEAGMYIIEIPMKNIKYLSPCYIN